MLNNKTSIPQSGSPTINSINEEKSPEINSLSLSPEEQKRFAAFLIMIEKAKLQRDQQRVEFDGLTYEQDYQANKNAANAYLFPKKNDDEIRVVTGTTEKKIEVLSNEIMSMNLQPEILAFDKNDSELRNLGQDMADIVKRTNEMEFADDIDQSALRELLTQRALFVQDIDEYITTNKQPMEPNSPFQPKAYKGKFNPQAFHRCRKVILSGLRVYLGDINIPARNFQTDQPYIVLYTRRSYTEAKTIYQNWDRWQYVYPSPGNSKIAIQPGSYRMHTLEANEVEEIKVLDPVNNEYYVILNGIPMLEKKTALPYEVLPWRRFNITMVVIKEMDTDFAYGKQPVASAKTLQALNDEILRNLIRKFRQALEPPLGVKTNGKAYSKDIWEAGSVTQGVSQDDFSILNPENKGVTQSEFTLYDLIEKKTEEFIGAGALQQGVAESSDQTATEIQTLQRNAIKNLGHIIAAYMRYKRNTTHLRIYNIIENFTEPVDKVYDKLNNIVQDTFQRFTQNNAIFPDNTRGKKIVQFMDRPITEQERQSMYDYERSETNAGRPTRIRVIRKDLLTSMMIFWYVVINSQQRDGSALSKIMFTDAMNQAATIAKITGRTPNADKLVDEFEARWQFKDMFVRNQQNQMPFESEVSQEEASQLSSKISGMDRTRTGQSMLEGVLGEAKKPTTAETLKQ